MGVETQTYESREYKQEIKNVLTKTHNADPVLASGSKKSEWFKTYDFPNIAGTLKKSAGLNGKLSLIWSSDGVGEEWYEQVVAQATSTTGGFHVPVKMPFYKVIFENTDATNPVNVTVNTYLKN